MGLKPRPPRPTTVAPTGTDHADELARLRAEVALLRFELDHLREHTTALYQDTADQLLAIADRTRQSFRLELDQRLAERSPSAPPPREAS